MTNISTVRPNSLNLLPIIQLSMVEARLRRPVIRKGKEMKLTILKTGVSDHEEARTIRRTLDGERADLQIKWVKHPPGEFEIVHLHCMKDKSTSEWKRGGKVPLENLYETRKVNPTTLVVKCKSCRRQWNSGG